MGCLRSLFFVVILSTSAWGILPTCLDEVRKVNAHVTSETSFPYEAAFYWAVHRKNDVELRRLAVRVFATQPHHPVLLVGLFGQDKDQQVRLAAGRIANDEIKPDAKLLYLFRLDLTDAEWLAHNAYVDTIVNLPNSKEVVSAYLDGFRERWEKRLAANGGVAPAMKNYPVATDADRQLLRDRFVAAMTNGLTDFGGGDDYVTFQRLLIRGCLTDNVCMEAFKAALAVPGVNVSTRVTIASLYLRDSGGKDEVYVEIEKLKAERAAADRRIENLRAQLPGRVLQGTTAKP